MSTAWRAECEHQQFHNRLNINYQQKMQPLQSKTILKSGVSYKPPTRSSLHFTSLPSFHPQNQSSNYQAPKVGFIMISKPSPTPHELIHYTQQAQTQNNHPTFLTSFLAPPLLARRAFSCTSKSRRPSILLSASSSSSLRRMTSRCAFTLGSSRAKRSTSSRLRLRPRRMSSSRGKLRRFC